MIMNEMEPGTGAVWRPQAVPAGCHQVASWDMIPDARQPHHCRHPRHSTSRCTGTSISIFIVIYTVKKHVSLYSEILTLLCTQSNKDSNKNKEK